MLPFLPHPSSPRRGIALNASRSRVSQVNVQAIRVSLLLAGVLAAEAAMQAPPFERYQVILDRKPFGDLPATNPPPPDGPQLIGAGLVVVAILFLSVPPLLAARRLAATARR